MRQEINKTKADDIKLEAETAQLVTQADDKLKNLGSLIDQASNGITEKDKVAAID